jgi:hypothetical protein
VKKLERTSGATRITRSTSCTASQVPFVRRRFSSSTSFRRQPDSLPPAASEMNNEIESTDKFCNCSLAGVPPLNFIVSAISSSATKRCVTGWNTGRSGTGCSKSSFTISTGYLHLLISGRK